jgi:hypothetical protein
MPSYRVAGLIACSFLLTAAGCDETPVNLPAGVVPAPYVAVTRATGICSDPDGQPYVPASAGETASLLVGVWQVCSGDGSTLIPGLRDGMELARDRRWQSLADMNGELTPVSEGVWYLSAEDPNDMVAATRWVVRIGIAGAATGYPVEFLQNPSKIRLGNTVTFVWLGE